MCNKGGPLTSEPWPWFKPGLAGFDPIPQTDTESSLHFRTRPGLFNSSQLLSINTKAPHVQHCTTDSYFPAQKQHTETSTSTQAQRGSDTDQTINRLNLISFSSVSERGFVSHQNRPEPASQTPHEMHSAVFSAWGEDGFSGQVNRGDDMLKRGKKTKSKVKSKAPLWCHHYKIKFHPNRLQTQFFCATIILCYKRMIPISSMTSTDVVV